MPLAAGSYLGNIPMRINQPGPNPNAYVSRAGALLRDRTKQKVLAFAGLRSVKLSGLGEIDLCDDPGWAAAREVTGLFSTIFGAAASVASTGTDSEGNTTTDAGWASAATAGGSTSTAMNAWRQQCIARSAGGTTQIQVEEALASQRLALEQQIATERLRNEGSLATLIASQQPRRAGIDQNTLLIGGAIVVAAIAGIYFLTR